MPLLPLPLLLACSPAPTALAPLDGPIQVHVDAAGIAHIQAQSQRDAFFAQGWQSAHDRIFQMDLLRRRAWGRRAEVLGEAMFASDLQSRALGFGAWGEATLAALPSEDPELYEAMAAYTDGVNAWLLAASLGRDDQSLPPQFQALGYQPEPWRIEDSAAIEKLLSAGLSMRADQDITLGLLDLLLGRDLFEDIYHYAPFEADWVVPDFYEGLDTSGLYSEGARVASTASPASPMARPDLDLSEPQALALLRAVSEWNLRLGGSNNQAVAGSRTERGHALLASDSHQGLGHPSVYWMVHLQGGEMDVMGASFPGVPMVLFGTNGQIAWGPTTSIYDAADVWLESYVGNSDDQVLFNGEAVDIERETVEILVRAEGGGVDEAVPVSVPLGRVPHHGPLFPTEALGLPVPLALSIRWNGFQARSIGRAFLDLARAQDVDQARDALGGYYSGGMHWLFADVDGRIGYESWSDLPIREQIDPENPPVTLLPGTGGYEWLPSDGSGSAPFQTIPRSLVPHRLDPVEGYLITANNDPVGQTGQNLPFDAPVYLSGIFDIGTRAARPRERIEQVLAERPMRFEDMVAVQLDTQSRLALKLLPFLFEAARRRPDLANPEALELLASWDLGCEVEQTGPTLFHAWLITTSRAMLADESSLLADLMFDDTDATLGLVLSKFVLRWLEATAQDIDAIEAGELPFPSASGRNFFDDRGTPELETRDELLLGALSQALVELAGPVEAAGGDPDDLATWTWGLLHTIELVDPALPQASSARLPKPGGLYTVDVADFEWLADGLLPERFATTNAPSNRFVFELDPQGPRAWMTLAGGQAEHPDSPFHNSLLEGYLAGEYADVPFGAAEVEDQAVESFRLEAGLDGVRRLSGS